MLGGQVRQVGDQHLTVLAEGAGDERDVGTFGDVSRHGESALDGLVVRVGMDEQQATIGHGTNLGGGPRRPS
ncbi:hypothetical protein GCM10022196_11000 [Aeromicrobium flavum]